MPKLFIKTLPSQEELHQSACQIYTKADPMTIYTNLLFRKLSTDIENINDNFFAKYDLSPGRYTLLLLLKKSPSGLMPSELAHKVGVTQATISGLINSLEKAELVARESHEKDGRAYVIKLTTKGQNLIQKIAPEWYPRVSNFWNQFNDSEKKQLNALFERMIQNIGLWEVEE